MPQNKNLSVVRNNSLFLGVNDSGLNINFNPKNFMMIEDGGIIYQPGDLSDAIYLIIEGEVKLKIADPDGHTVLRKGKDEYFGEKEALDNLARKSSAVANMDTLLYMIKKNDLITLIQKNSVVKATLLGETKEKGIEETATKEIVFNEPKGKLSDLPFFKKKKDLQIKDEAIPENNIINNEELREAENIIPESDNEYENNNPPSDDILNITDEIHPVEESVIPEINNYTDSEKDEVGSELNQSIIEEDTDIFSTKDPEKADIEQLDYTIIEDDYPKPSFTFIDQIHIIRKIFSGLTTEEILIAIPEAICELLNATRGRLFLINKELTEFRTREKKKEEYSEIKVKIADNLLTESFHEKKIININNPPEEELEKISAGSDIRSILIFPLKDQKEEIIAMLELNNSYNGVFTDDDEIVLTKISPLLTLALENADFLQNLLQSERLVSLNKTANFLIQDIKNPIVTIKQYAEHIKKQNLNEDILPVLDMIEEQADSVMNLVQTTLRYSEGILISKPTTILFSTAMDNILALLAEYVESREVKLFKKYDGDGLVNLDRKEFYQACFQIAKNACDAMPQGGNVYIIVKREGESIRIEFKDTGLGIPDSIKDRIFEPFMSHGKEDHTGLGLAIAERIIKEHNGKIRAESDLGEGSVIIIDLPAAD